MNNTDKNHKLTTGHGQGRGKKDPDSGSLASGTDDQTPSVLGVTVAGHCGGRWGGVGEESCVLQRW